MQLFQRLKIILQSSLNEIYLILFGLIFLLISLSFQSILAPIVLILYLLILFIKRRTIFIISITLFMLIGCNYGLRLILLKQNERTIEEAIVVQVEKRDYDYRLTVKKKGLFGIKYLVYTDQDGIIPGDQIKLTGQFMVASSEHLPNGFNYHKYLQQKMIAGTIKSDNIIVLRHGLSLHVLNYYLNQYLQNHFRDADFLGALVIGRNQDLDTDLKQQITNLGISHLFVVSGLHVGLLTSALAFIFRKLKIKPLLSSIIITIFLFIYLIINDFSISITRVFINYLLAFLLKKYALDPFNRFSLNVIITSFFNPLRSLSYSYILTYLISGFLVLTKVIFDKTRFKLALTTILSLFVTLPLVSLLNGQVNLMMLFSNLVMVPLVSYAMVPLSIITMILSFLEPIYHYVIIAFRFLINLESYITLFINLPVMAIDFYLLYYGLLFAFLSVMEKRLIDKKTMKLRNVIIHLVSLFLIIIIWNQKLIFNIYYRVTFFNVKEGDAILIEYPHHKKNILIDTSNDQEIVSTLVKWGITTLDEVYITHSDNDHNGYLDLIGQVIKIKKVLINPYDQVTSEIVNNLSYEVPIITLRANDQITSNSRKMMILNPKYDYHDANNNSLCMIMDLVGFTFLFTGDIEAKAEEAIFKTSYDIDFLKVPHHGSNTSSSKYLLDNVHPKLAVAINGYQTQFNFPSSFVINRYQTYDIPLYNTRFDQNIQIILDPKQNRYRLIKI